MGFSSVVVSGNERIHVSEYEGARNEGKAHSLYTYIPK